MVIERTRDWQLIKRIVTDRSVYPKISDDRSPCADCWEPCKDEAMYYLLAKNKEDILGIFAVFQMNGVTFNVHTCLLPHSYGEKAARAAKELIDWVFSNLDCRRLVTEVPEFNKLALRFAQHAGMEKYGFNPGSYLKNGHLYGITLLGLSKEVM